jgi:large subunit ribosomal protein L10
MEELIMSLTLEQKKAIVSEIAEVAAKSPTAIAAEYIGLNVAEISALRKSAREAGIYLKVVRNTLAKRALEDTRFACMREGLTGPLLLAFSNEEPGSAAKVIRDFSKGNEKLVVKLVSSDGKLLAVSDIERLASLPSLDQARSMFLGVLKAPMGKLVRVLAEPEAKFARLLAARRDQQQAA